MTQTKNSTRKIGAAVRNGKGVTTGYRSQDKTNSSLIPRYTRNSCFRCTQSAAVISWELMPGLFQGAIPHIKSGGAAPKRLGVIVQLGW